MFKFKSGEGVAKAGEPAEIENSKQEEGALKQTPISENSVEENPVTKNEGAAAQDAPASPSQGDVFKGQTFKVRAQNKEGQRVVTEVSGGVEESTDGELG